MSYIQPYLSIQNIRTGTQWRSFGRALNLDGITLDELGALYEEHGHQELVWSVLEEWARQTENPTEEELKKAIDDLQNPAIQGTIYMYKFKSLGSASYG